MCVRVPAVSQFETGKACGRQRYQWSYAPLPGILGLFYAGINIGKYVLQLML